MNDFNILGNVVRDAKDLSKNDKQTAALTLAIKRSYEKTDFVDFMAFGKTADLLIKYAKKGKPLFVSGIISTYKDKETNHTKTSLIIRSVTFVDGGARDVNHVKTENKTMEIPF